MKDVPAEYYRVLAENEASHWWSRGMRSVIAALLDPIVAGREHQSLLDAGCGAGGFLAWADGLGAFDRLAGTDLSAEAIELARRRMPQADLHFAPLHSQPFQDETFDVAVLFDVLQHVEEDEVQAGLRELRRVLRPHGHLLVRTNAGRRPRRERSDWRLYDASALRTELEAAGFSVARLTHVNAVPGLWASLRRQEPRAPTATTCGMGPPPGRLVSAVGLGMLHVEASLLRRTRRALPYGHSLVAVGTPGRALGAAGS